MEINMAETLDKLRIPKVVTTIEDRYWEALFFVMILSYTIAILNEALGYSEDARLFPVLIGSALVVMILLKLGLLLFGDRLNITGTNLFDSMTADIAADDTDEESFEVDTATRYGRELEMIGWSFMLVGLIWLLGFRLAMVVFVTSYILRHERSIKRAVGATVFTWIGIDLIFIRLLSVTLWEGMLVPEWLFQLLP